MNGDNHGDKKGNGKADECINTLDLELETFQKDTEQSEDITILQMIFNKNSWSICPFLKT